jgi:AraC family transcriptional regulator
MKRAAIQLSSSPTASITTIAIEAGYDAPDAFARAFRERFGQTPSIFRATPDLALLEQALHPFDQARSKLMPFSPDQVTIREVPDTAVACMTHHGDPATIHTTVKRFIEWRQASGLAERELRLFGVFPTDTRVTAPEDFRMDICVESAGPIAPNADGVHPSLIPGGRCAVLRVLGLAGDDLEAAALFLYRDWLPKSGEELRDFPIYCERVKFYPLVPRNDAITDVYLPLL